MRREHDQWVARHEQGLIASSVETFAQLVFLTVLMALVPVEVAMTVARDVGVGFDDADRRVLSVDLQSCYPPDRAGRLDLR